MKNTMVLLAALFGASIASSDLSQQGVHAQGVAAIQKVVQMLGDMQAKAKREKSDESVAFAEFSQWCDMEQSKFGKSIKKQAGEIENLGSSINKLTDEAKKLGEDISKLNNQIAKHEADMKSRKNTRAKEHSAYTEESTDYAESVSALERAIEVMSKQNYDRSSSSAALLQVSQSSRLPEKAQDLIAAFLGEDSDGDDYASPEAHGYEAQSGGIIDMLKNLLDDFRSQKNKCDKEEANAKQAFDMVMMDLADTVAGAERDVSAKSSTKSKHEEKTALNKKQKTSTELVKVEDEGTLKDVVAQCTEKKFSFEEKQQLRADEIEAIGKAIDIMSSSDVSSFIEQAAVVGRRMLADSFAQLRSSNQAGVPGLRHEVRDFIAGESRRLKSHTLSLLVERLEADPFAKIKGLIGDMVERLMKEANEDAEHEGFCDTEMGKSKVTRTQLTEDIDSLMASLEDGKSEIMSLSESNTELSTGIQDINSAKGEATKMRTAEKQKNTETIADAEAAVKAVDAATAVLKDFYKKASEATALVQGGGTATALTRGIKMGSDDWNALASSAAPVDKGHKEGMQSFGDTYKGNQDGATGVLAMIDVIRSDFANLAADTAAGEASSVKAFDDFNVESKRNLAMKAKKMELNEADKATAEKKLREDTKDLASNQESLAAADKYYAKLAQQCAAPSSSYEERAKARAAEIQSLKEALKML